MIVLNLTRIAKTSYIISNFIMSFSLLAIPNLTILTIILEIKTFYLCLLYKKQFLFFFIKLI